jgi:hypothetical protein
MTHDMKDCGYGFRIKRVPYSQPVGGKDHVSTNAQEVERNAVARERGRVPFVRSTLRAVLLWSSTARSAAPRGAVAVPPTRAAKGTVKAGASF